MSAFLRQRTAVAGLVLLILIVLFCFVGPLIDPTDQTHSTVFTSLPPSGAHPLGTDANGFDVLGRMMQGGRSTLVIALAVGICASVLGALWGALAGLRGGWLDAVMMRIVDVFLALPAVFVLIYLATVITPTIPVLILVISLLSWLGPARLIRGETLSIRTREFVSASRGMGAGTPRIIVRHLLPNTISTLLVNATFQVADAIVLLATLSFLGFGLPAPAATWGGMLSQGTTYLPDGFWWEIYPVGVLIMVTVIAVNLVGEGLRTALEGG
jgi:peptide/nickel transport system permease protein